jgi:hypothetical protein
VAKLCTQCGKPLPRDDARFCNSCGTDIASAPAKSALASPRTGLVFQQRQGLSNASSRPAMREQIAFPPQRLEPPTRMNRLESGNQVHPRELRVKVWEDRETGNLSHPEVQNGGKVSAQAPHVADTIGAVVQEKQVEDVPTIAMPAAIIPGQESKPKVSKLQHEPRFASTRQARPMEDVDDQPTSPLELNASGGPRMPSVPVRTERPIYPDEAHLPATPPVQWPRLAQSIPAPTRPFSGQQQWQAQPQVRRKGKSRLVIVLALFLLLGVGGAATWIIVFQPFAVAGITRTSAAFQNNGLGIALQFPQGWTAQVDQSKEGAYFYDSNHTYQLNILRVATQGQSIDQYIKKEEAQLGMTAPKDQSPLTFAGATWQQVQGTALQSGATYTETLLVTTRGNHFYALVQMAPAPTYADADRLFFTAMRSSLQFL